MRTLIAIALLAVSTVAAASGGYFRYPALHGDTLVFTAEGDLWKVPIAGGDAQRLTSHPGPETHAAISPDGKWIAFTGAYEGPAEAYVMPFAGGVPKRLTWFADAAEVVGWNGNAEVLVATRYFHGLRKLQLVAIAPATGQLRRVPLSEAGRAAALGDGSIVFTRGDRRGDNVREYRGGGVTTLWRFREGVEAVALTTRETNSADPLVWKQRIVFASDRSGVTNLWSMNHDGQDLRQHTRHTDFEVRGASISGDRVAYQLGADLRVIDLASGEDRVVAIRLVSDFDHQRERWVRKPLEQQFTSAALAANGERVAIVARGRAVTAGIGDLRRIDIGLPQGTRARSAELSADGKSVLVVADTSGESELWLFPADGGTAGRQVSRDADATRIEASPSPDGKWIAHHDRRRRLWLTEVVTGTSRLLHEEVTTGTQAFARIAWAPDSSAFAAENLVGTSEIWQLALYRVSDGKRIPLASTRYHSFSASFSPDGKWLWFLGDRNFEALHGTPWGDRNMGPYFDKRTRAYALALQPGLRFPFRPRDELEVLVPEPERPDPSKPAPVRVEPPRLEPPPTRPTQPSGQVPEEKTAAEPPRAASPGEPPRPVAPAKVPAIVWEGLERRLYEVPLPPGNYTRLASDGKRLWFLEAETTPERKGTLKSIAIDNAGAPAETFTAEVRQFAVSADGKKLFFRKWATAPNPGDMYIVDPTPRPPAELSRFQVKLADWQFVAAPREEWAQLFADAWRMHRDWFYDKDLHRVDWKAMRAKYGALLPRVTDREELSDLIAQMSAELSLLHSQVRRGDMRRGDVDVQPATLGAQYERAADGVRIARLYRADPEVLSSLPPLAHTDVAAAEGDVLVAIDGKTIGDVSDVYAALRDKGGKQVLLELRAPGKPARKSIATAAVATREAEFKQRDYDWRTRELVVAASKGRFGYLHLRAMGSADLAAFAREFYPMHDREGLIIDVRDNTGGNIDSILIEKLMRRAWAYWRSNSGALRWNMQAAFRGPIVVLIDGATYSDGETFAEGMRRLGLATLVGTRTAGAGVWLSDGNTLMDGGIARAAEFGQIGLDGAWLIEGRGVTPDVEVDNPPNATFRGEDAQLAAAIRILEEKLAANPVKAPNLPAYPKR